MSLYEGIRQSQLLELDKPDQLCLGFLLGVSFLAGYCFSLLRRRDATQRPPLEKNELESNWIILDCTRNSGIQHGILDSTSYREFRRLYRKVDPHQTLVIELTAYDGYPRQCYAMAQLINTHRQRSDVIVRVPTRVGGAAIWPCLMATEIVMNDEAVLNPLSQSSQNDQSEQIVHYRTKMDQMLTDMYDRRRLQKIDAHFFYPSQEVNPNLFYEDVRFLNVSDEDFEAGLEDEDEDYDGNEECECECDRECECEEEYEEEYEEEDEYDEEEEDDDMPELTGPDVESSSSSEDHSSGDDDDSD